MELTLPTYAKAYSLLTKPGIIFGNIITTAAGFALASQGKLDFGLLFATLAGLSFIIASACVFNNYIDRKADEKMARTKNRALAMGTIDPKSAIVFAFFLGSMGSLFLALFSSSLALWLSLTGFIVYVLLYSFTKYQSVHGTLIGSIAGALPPVIGYCAVNPHLDSGALLLFSIVALWQMPHFYAIAINRLDDYRAASIPVLPLKKGLHETKIHMLLYILAFMAASSLLTLCGHATLFYLIVSNLLGLGWLYLCIKGFKCASDRVWAKKMFLFSLVVIMGCSAAMSVSIP